ncbi:MAG TPA: DinB family protein [Terriglobales bacterium]|nr:DinB family protein [Terriglobales bacterium]
MSEIQRVLDHYDGVLRGEAWHGDPVWEVLAGISPQQAAARVAPSVHTIWEIVMHMTFWENVAAQRLAGLRAGLVEELNFPAMPAANEDNWHNTLDQLRAADHAFRQALAALDAGKFDELSAAGKRTFYDEAHGLLEHHVYHLGQIALLKKMAI